MRIFVSTEYSEDPLSKAIVARVSREGWSLDQSPTNPDDPRWREWYSVGCARAIALADAVVSVFTPGWDGSTWMCHEAWVALHTPRPLFLWNPVGRCVPPGMLRFAKHPLPADLDEVIAVLANVRPTLAQNVGALPAAEPSRERHALELFPLTISPEEYAARHGHEWLCFSFDDYRYSDPSLNIWIHRLGDILFRRGAAPSLSELRVRYLSPDERSLITEEEGKSGGGP
jgi:hypothetical protein